MKGSSRLRETSMTSKHVFPTATAQQYRLRIFQPTRRPKMLEEVIETAWGKIRVKGKIGQGHADVMDAIMFSSIKAAAIEDGRIKLLVDPFKVRQFAGGGNQMSGQQLKANLDDLIQALIEIKEPVELACVGHLIDHIDLARASNGEPITKPNPLTGLQRPLWRVELGKAMSQLVRAGIWRTYDPTQIARLTSGISQAVARHVLTHEREPRGGWKMDGLIVAVGGELDTVSMRHRRRELRADAAGLVELAIVIDGNRVRMQQTPGAVQQTPGAVQRTPGVVQQTPGSCSKRPAAAAF